MNTENPSDPQTSDADVRKRAATRLIVAGLVTTTALAGLWWLDQDRRGAPRDTPQPRPLQAIQPAMPEPAPTPETGESPEAPQPEANAEAGTEPSAELDAPRANPLAMPLPPGANQPPPPPRVDNTPPAPRAGMAPPSPTMPPPPLPPAPPAAGYVVQFGVFSNPLRAQELVDQLRKQGIQARSETRVHLGPFATRAEAEQAQAAMRKLGKETLITTAAATK